MRGGTVQVDQCDARYYISLSSISFAFILWTDLSSVCFVLRFCTSVFTHQFHFWTGWAWRWFVLSDNVLTYYTTKVQVLCRKLKRNKIKDKRAKGDKRGSIPVRGAFLSIEEDTNFSLTVDDHTYHFQVSKSSRARPGFEPGTSRIRSANHTPRPTSHTLTVNIWSVRSKSPPPQSHSCLSQAFAVFARDGICNAISSISAMSWM